MKYFTKEVQIGLVATVAIVVLFFGMQFLKGQTMFSSDNSFYVHFDDVSARTDPFFVALRNNNTTADEDLKFKVMDNDGVTYYGAKTVPAAYKAGTFVSMKNTRLTGRLELSVSSETVSTAL